MSYIGTYSKPKKAAAPVKKKAAKPVVKKVVKAPRTWEDAAYDALKKAIIYLDKNATGWKITINYESIDSTDFVDLTSTEQEDELRDFVRSTFRSPSVNNEENLDIDITFYTKNNNSRQQKTHRAFFSSSLNSNQYCCGLIDMGDCSANFSSHTEVDAAVVKLVNLYLKRGYEVKSTSKGVFCYQAVLPKRKEFESYAKMLLACGFTIEKSWKNVNSGNQLEMFVSNYSL